jgi:hypothetical protein
MLFPVCNVQFVDGGIINGCYVRFFKAFVDEMYDERENL